MRRNFAILGWGLVLLLTLVGWRASRASGSADGFLIEPGARVGPLRLGDSRVRAFSLFPLKIGTDQETQLPNCGLEYIWVDLDKSHLGNVTVRFKDDKVFQIESATNKFRTTDGVTSGASPDEVRSHYQHLRAYTSLGRTSEAMGERPLIYWVDADKGIAFVLAYARSKRNRYIYSIIVFEPKRLFCAEGIPANRSNLRELVPYSVEVPNSSTD